MALTMGMGWALDWVLIAIAAATLLYTYLTWNFGYWRKRSVPQIEATPLFGSLKDLILNNKSAGEVFQKMYWDLDGHSWGGFYQSRRPAVLVRDPELVKNVLVRDFASFHDNDIHTAASVDPLFAQSPFAAAGEKWKTHRVTLSPAFTPGKIKALFPHMQQVSENMLTYLENKDGPVEAKQLSALYTTDVVASCTFGVEGNSFKNPDAEFRAMGKKLVSADLWRNIELTIMLQAPSLSKLLRLKFVTKEVATFFRRLIQDVRTNREQENISRNDYVQFLSEIQKKNKGYSETDFLSHSIMFFSEGFETSSTVMSFTLFELAVHPEIQRRLREEVDDALKRHDGRLDYDVVSELPYLDMVFSEVMRIYPVVYTINRVCTKPYSLPTANGGNVTVEAGTPLLIPVYALHRDAEYYPEPSKFDPERFNSENKPKLNRFAYLPFGEGPRICIGLRFAFAQMKAAIVTILSRFEVHRCEKTVYPVVTDPSYFIFAAKDGVWVKFVKRTDK